MAGRQPTSLVVLRPEHGLRLIQSIITLLDEQGGQLREEWEARYPQGFAASILDTGNGD